LIIASLKEISGMPKGCFNVLGLSSTNQYRMYKILKQHEKIKENTLVLSLDELKERLGMGKNEYSRYGDFKYRVLDPCQKALQKNTDIRFIYEPYGKKGKGGKVLALKFYIEKNEGHSRQIIYDTLDDCLKKQEWPEFQDEPAELADELSCGEDDECEKNKSVYEKRIKFFMDAFCGEFSFKQVVALNDKMRDCLSYSKFIDEVACYHYLNNRYNEMIRLSEKNKILNRFGYVKNLIGKEI